MMRINTSNGLIIMKFIAKIKASFQKKQTEQTSTNYESLIQQANERISRMERNYLVLLKRLLEMDGVRLVPTTKSSALSSTVMQTTTTSETNKGLNEQKPTLH